MIKSSYFVGGHQYGGGSKKNAEKKWEFIKSPVLGKTESGGRLLIRLSASEDAVQVWKKMVDTVSHANNQFQTVIKIGRPLDVNLGSEEVPVLIYVANPNDTTAIDGIVTTLTSFGCSSSYTVKDSNGNFIRGSQQSSNESPVAKRMKYSMSDIKVVDDEDIESIDWSAVGNSLSMDCVDDIKGTNIADFTGTIDTDTLPGHAAITQADVPMPSISSEKSESYFPRRPDNPENGEDISASDFYKMFVDRTSDQCATELSAPQRSSLWLQARTLCITASDFGGAVGHNAYSSPDDLIQRKLWDTFQGNQATAWGSFCEDLAADAFVAWTRRTFPRAQTILHTENLIKCSSTPWMAVSPDGILESRDASGRVTMDLVEFKCPTKESRLGGKSSHPYSQYPSNVPPYYMDQIQGISGYINHRVGGFRGHQLSSIWFVVWRPSRLWVTKVPIDNTYFTESLYPALERFYFGRLLPAFAHKYNNRLREGEISPNSILRFN